MAQYHEPDESVTLGNIFLGLLSAGAVLTALLLVIVIFSPRLHRHPTWINFCVTWTVFPIAYIILYIAGKAQGPPPSLGLCLTQASLIYTVPVLCGLAAFMLILQVWFDQRSTSSPDYANSHRLRTACLVFAPWFGATLILVEAIVLGLQDRDQVRRMGGFAYCVITTTVPGHVSAFVIAGILVLSVLFQVLIAKEFFKHRKQMEKDYRASFPTDVMIRLALFTVVVISTIGMMMTFSYDEINRITVDALIAPLPLTMFFIFGIQRDVVNVFLFRKPPPPRHTESPQPVLSTMTSVVDIA